MSEVLEQIDDTGFGVTVVRSLDALHRISETDCPGVICHRPSLPGVQTWIDALSSKHLPSMRAILEPQAARGAVGAACDAAAMPQCPERRVLIDDIVTLVETFATIMKAPFLRLRLDRVTTNACRKFHVDALSARLICTYRGTATQFGVSNDRTDLTRVFTAPTGAPIVLRGSFWPEQPAVGLRHRSPPIEGTGETRLVLVLDPIFGSEHD